MPAPMGTEFTDRTFYEQWELLQAGLSSGICRSISSAVAIVCSLLLSIDGDVS